MRLSNATGEPFSAGMVDEMRAGLAELRDDMRPTVRETLRDAIRAHGGPAMVVEQMGFARGSKEYTSTLRTVERHYTEAGERRGKQNDPLAPPTRAGRKDYGELYTRVLGKETVEHIRSGVGKRLPMPRTGSVTITITGTIKVSKDVRKRSVTSEKVSARHFQEDLFGPDADPAETWGDGFNGRAFTWLDIEQMEFTYTG